MPQLTNKRIRREAREAVLQMLYARELNGQSALEVEGWYADNHPLPLAARQFSHELLAAALERKSDAEALYFRFLRDWRPERLSVIDRCILWMAATELLGERFVPVAVLVDEYVHLAKRFSQPQAAPWVHAVLDAMGKNLRPAAAPAE